jgi:hypothetical protein
MSQRKKINDYPGFYLKHINYPENKKYIGALHLRIQQ